MIKIKDNLNSAKSEYASKEKEYNEKLAEFQEKEPEALQEIADNEVKLAYDTFCK